MGRLRFSAPFFGAATGPARDAFPMHHVRRLLGTAALALASALTSAPAAADDLRIGIIGLDTSHVIAFTQLLNDPADQQHIPGAKVVVAFRGGSPDIESSWSRVPQYTEELRTKHHVRMVESVEELCTQVDAVLLESVDGRPHLAQARPVIAAGKPLFVDKPVAGTLHDAVELYRLAAEHKVPVFSSSAYRYYSGMVTLKKTDIGDLRAAISYGPAHYEPHHPDFFWYGIHPVEALFTVLGSGCETVSRVTSADTDTVTGSWPGGRLGTFVALRAGPLPHKVIAFGTKGTAEQGNAHEEYTPLVREIIRFFQTGIAPVTPEETLAIYAFMEAADESKRQGGAAVRLADVLKKAGG